MAVMSLPLQSTGKFLSFVLHRQEFDLNPHPQSPVLRSRRDNGRGSHSHSPAERRRSTVAPRQGAALARSIARFLIKPPDLAIYKKSISRDGAAENTPDRAIGATFQGAGGWRGGDEWMMGGLDKEKKEKGEKLGWCEGSRRGAEGSGREDEKKEEGRVEQRTGRRSAGRC